MVPVPYSQGASTDLFVPPSTTLWGFAAKRFARFAVWRGGPEMGVVEVEEPEVDMRAPEEVLLSLPWDSMLRGIPSSNRARL